MKDNVSAFTSFVIELHKRNNNFCRSALKLIDKYLDEGKTAVSLRSCCDSMDPSKNRFGWKTEERGVHGRLLADQICSDPVLYKALYEALCSSQEHNRFVILSISGTKFPEDYLWSASDYPEAYRLSLMEEGIREQLLLPLQYKDRIIGVLSIFRGIDDPFFTRDSLHLLQEAARVISSFYYFDNRRSNNINYYFRRFLDNMDVGAALIDRQLLIKKANDAFLEYFGYVWKEGILTGKIPTPAGNNMEAFSDPQKLIFHFGSRIIVNPSKLRCECLLYSFSIYAKPLDYANAFGEIETVYLIYVSKYKKINSEDTMALLNDLTPRETELLTLLAGGNDNGQIAEKLHITTHTVKSHLQSIYRKLGVTNKTELITILYGK